MPADWHRLHPLNPQKRLLDKAVERVRAGGVIVYPTDSCYALGCRLGDKAAMDRVRAIRRFDRHHLFTVVCRSLAEVGRYARVERPMGFVAFDVSMEFEQPAGPVTGLRVVMHADPGAPAAGWGWGGEEVGAKGDKKSFAVTNISVSAGTVASDQVNLYRLLPLRTATACCWSGEDRPEGV